MSKNNKGTTKTKSKRSNKSNNVRKAVTANELKTAPINTTNNNNQDKLVTPNLKSTIEPLPTKEKQLIINKFQKFNVKVFDQINKFQKFLIQNNINQGNYETRYELKVIDNEKAEIKIIVTGNFFNRVDIDSLKNKLNKLNKKYSSIGLNQGTGELLIFFGMEIKK